MKSVFIDTSGHCDFLSRVTPDKYDLEALIRACDSPNVVYSKESKDTDTVVVNHIVVFARTIKENKIVKCNTTGKFMFESKIAKFNFPSGVSLNDCMMFMLKDLLYCLYNESYGKNPQILALNSAPTPFGIIKRADGTNESLFQLVLNHEVLTDINHDFSYVPVEEAEKNISFHEAYKQFKFTKEE